MIKTEYLKVIAGFSWDLFLVFSGAFIAYLLSPLAYPLILCIVSLFMAVLSVIANVILYYREKEKIDQMWADLKK